MGLPERVVGSSPHTRGTHGVALSLVQICRFIPAHAGNTAGYTYNVLLNTVHPRTRGEHSAGLFSVSQKAGSSPHTRGTRWPAHAVPWSSRFIPAHAGNTRSSCASCRACTVHPRTRGEHYDSSQHAIYCRGSSPHTRGTRTVRIMASMVSRFIPAHAGNTFDVPQRDAWGPVHPRTRGEHSKPSRLSADFTGSSPHTRGTRGGQVPPHDVGRFIPAHAGNTYRYDDLQRHIPVHPRTRGEHDVLCNKQVVGFGSSPHTRGTRTPIQSARPCRRFIPAHAGNTPSSRPRAGSPPVHPRTRGEHPAPGPERGDQPGSSPHTRGTPSVLQK